MTCIARVSRPVSRPNWVQRVSAAIRGRLRAAEAILREVER